MQHVLRIREYQALKGFPDIYLKAMRVTAVLVLTIGCEMKVFVSHLEAERMQEISMHIYIYYLAILFRLINKTHMFLLNMPLLKGIFKVHLLVHAGFFETP